MKIAIYAMVFLGSLLMVFNIYGFFRFALKARNIDKARNSGRNVVLNIPIVLLVLFLLGYIAVGAFGKPDLIVSGILFGGSIFVFVMYIMLERIMKRLSVSKEIEAKLMATEESNRAKTEFLADMSHEMRTPLNIILGLDTMALKDTALAGETRDRLEKIGSNANYLLGLINSILDINSIDTGDFLIKNEEFSVSDVVSQIDIIAKLHCKEKDLTYKSSVSEGADGTFSGDDMRCRQIVFSLLDYAIEHTAPHGAVEFCVDSTGEGGDTSLVFKVKDTGEGIGPELLPSVFDAAAGDGKGTTGSFGGSSLGLPAAKKLVTALGGTISAESEVGVGSVFTVVLPVTRVVEDESLYDGVSLAGRRILIAEDIPENAEIVADLLELEGVESEHAENGKIAVDMFRGNEPGYYDAILMDLRMPVMDGLTAAKEIRKTDREDASVIPIIALTANAFESDVKESLGAGMNLHLAKPADCEKLYGAIKKTIYETGSKKGSV
ncbi:MAG: response regulator [Clostridia bacterium]|nr:response regulator [Clostridia bacterium]